MDSVRSNLCAFDKVMTTLRDYGGAGQTGEHIGVLRGSLKACWEVRELFPIEQSSVCARYTNQRNGKTTSHGIVLQCKCKPSIERVTILTGSKGGLIEEGARNKY